MKAYISADMEGIGGVVAWEHTQTDGRDYSRFRHLMTREVNAAIEGCLEGGAKEVTVNDAHENMKNLILEDLHSEARLISGSPKPWSMMEGLDATFHAVLFIGYHARAGCPGVLSHTYTESVLELSINGMALGEIGMNAAFAGCHGVPVVMVSGDSSAVKEAQDLLAGLGPLQTVTVKYHISRFVGDNLHPEKIRLSIREGARLAVQQSGCFRPWVVEPPIEMRVKFINPGLADNAAIMPGTIRIDGTTVAYESGDYATGLRAARAMIALGARD